MFSFMFMFMELLFNCFLPPPKKKKKLFVIKGAITMFIS